MRKGLILIACLIVSKGLFSQKREDTVKRIINYGLSVYAHDVTSLKDDERRTLDSLIQNSATITNTIESLKQRNGQLKNVGGKTEDWLKLANVAGSSGNYGALITKMEETLKNPNSSDQKILTWRKQHVSTLFRTPVDSFLKPADGERETADEQQETETTNDLTAVNTINKAPMENNTLLWLALTAGIVSLIGVAAILVMMMRKYQGYQSFRMKNRDEVAALWQAIELLKNKQPETTSKPVPATEERIKELQVKIAALEGKFKGETSTNPSKKEVQPSAVTVQPPPKKIIAEKPVLPITLYAKLADLSNGFSEAILTDGQNGEQIFEITAKDKAATFLISNDANAQKYALSNYRYYLENACVILNEPTPNCRIDTKELGELSKTGNEWIIKKKAQIEFI